MRKIAAEKNYMMLNGERLEMGSEHPDLIRRDPYPKGPLDLSIKTISEKSEVGLSPSALDLIKKVLTKLEDDLSPEDRLDLIEMLSDD